MLLEGLVESHHLCKELVQSLIFIRELAQSHLVQLEVDFHMELLLLVALCLEQPQLLEEQVDFKVVQWAQLVVLEL